MRLPKESPREKKILKCGIMKIWQILQYDSSISQFSVLSFGRRIQAKKIVVAFERTSPEFQLRARSWGRAVVQTKIQLFSHFLLSSSHQHQHQPTSHQYHYQHHQPNNHDGHLGSEEVDNTVPHSLEKIKLEKI